MKPRTRLGRALLRALGKRRPLTGRERKCATKFIAEEVRTGKYSQKQAIAIGLSRARKEC